MDSVNAKGKCGAEAAPQPGKARLDLDEVRERLREQKGPEFWRSLDELAGTPEFEDIVNRELPRFASVWPEGMSRRGFLQLTSASLALAGLTGCTKQPLEKIIPYVRQPEQLIPGKPLFFATAVTHGGVATGVLAESHQGRPTKLEGNPDHPASRGAADYFTQAAVLGLYDPDRSQEIVHNGRNGTWSALASQMGETVRTLAGGQGLRILTGTVTSPTLADQIQAILKAHPNARWHRWEPAGPHQTRAAAVAAFGRPLDTRYDFTKAKVVLSLGADVFCEGAAGVRYARDFADGRRVHAHRDTMTRFYTVESAPVGASSLADHRLQLPPAQVEGFVLALAQELGVAAGAAPLADAKARTWVQEVAQDLQANRGASLVVGDEYLSPAAQVLVHAVNGKLGNVGATVFYQEPVEADPVDHVQSLAALVRDMAAGQVSALLILDGVNPMYTAPADLPFKEAFEKVSLRIHHGLYLDETALHCHWHVPAAHELESWGDARSFDGTVSIQQPLIEPLYGGKTAGEVLAALLGNQPDATGYDLVRQYWTSRLPGLAAGLAEAARDTSGGGSNAALFGMGGPFPGAPGIGGGAPPAAAPPAGQPQTAAVIAPVAAVAPVTPAPGNPAPGSGTSAPSSAVAAAPAGAASAAFERAWREALHAGLIPDTAARPATAALNGGAVQQAAAQVQAALAAAKPGDITLLLRPDPTIWDGRYASNVWLQEVPKPVTKLVWDNALVLGPKTAARLKLTFHDTAEISLAGRTVKKVAVWVLPGIAEDTAVLTLGYGREHAGKGTGLGFNAYPLRTSTALWGGPGLAVKSLGEQLILACTQNHHAMRGIIVHEDEEAAQQAEARHVIRTATLAELQANPNLIKEDREAPSAEETLYPNRRYDGHAWGMAIDLSVCTGCSACIVACQAENNIPSVGKEQVLARREMHWLRVDRYFAGDLEEPTLHYQPLPCMQCENAPCEVVCPVAATTHSDEGLNDMVYNRCVGTRYCSNNCPYKVRRFNFLRYSDKDTPVLELLNNPDVTVRMRGVMEKCTYCVQRIEAAKIQSKVDRQPIPPSWIQTACQQTCPTGAIVFGDLNNAESEAAKLKADPLNYGLLEDINTRPRTTYLAKLSNPNPAIAGPVKPAAEGAEHGHA
jgi:molybdopterin-containing oxidoreductase family iron-sulfur binding subunit